MPKTWSSNYLKILKVYESIRMAWYYESWQVKNTKIESSRRNTYKTLLFSAVDTIDWINVSMDEKLEIMKSVKKLVENKIVKISKSF